MDTTVTAREAADTIDALTTPSLLLDRARLKRNTRRLAERAAELGVVLRPHMKTAKSIDVAVGFQSITTSSFEAAPGGMRSQGLRDAGRAISFLRCRRGCDTLCHSNYGPLR